MGLPPMTALQIATISTARHYRLRNFGAIAPRYFADFIVFDDLKKLVVRQTYKKGILAAEEGKYLASQRALVPRPRSTMNLHFKAPEDFKARLNRGARMRVIEVVPNQIVTRQTIETPRSKGGPVVPDVERDILKLVVVERHHATGNVGVGFVRGFKLKSGALGSTVAHDAHNVVVVGTNDTDIARAIVELVKMQGGQVAIQNGKARAELALPIAGLVSDRPLKEVIERIAALNATARAMGCALEASFMTLSFLSLSPIPELKLTDQSLIDAVHMWPTKLFA
jgi:adenine deaminase